MNTFDFYRLLNDDKFSGQGKQQNHHRKTAPQKKEATDAKKEVVVIEPDVIEKKAEAVTIEEAEPTPQPEPTPTMKKATLEEDIEALAKWSGGLYNGKVVEIPLSDALTIMPRDRKRVDAYDLLAKKIRNTYGAELIVTSRKTKKL